MTVVRAELAVLAVLRARRAGRQHRRLPRRAVRRAPGDPRADRAPAAAAGACPSRQSAGGRRPDDRSERAPPAAAQPAGRPRAARRRPPRSARPTPAEPAPDEAHPRLAGATDRGEEAARPAEEATPVPGLAPQCRVVSRPVGLSRRPAGRRVVPGERQRSSGKRGHRSRRSLPVGAPLPAPVWHQPSRPCGHCRGGSVRAGPSR